jgi:hypothetical protein
MARKVTKEEIANGVFIDGGQLEKISDDVVETFNNLELNSIGKKYQVTQAVMTDGYGGQQKTNVWFNSLNVPQTVTTPNYPIEGGADLIKNKYRVKGYNDQLDVAPSPTTDGNAWLFWTQGMTFNKPVIIVNWTVYLQGADQYYSFDGELPAGGQAQSGIRCIIQAKNFFDPRDRRIDDILLNSDANLLRERFYGSSIDAPSSTFERLRFPVPPSEITGWYIEHHTNIMVPEQAQLNFIMSMPSNRLLAPYTAETVENTKVTSVVTFLEEIE